ncbi:MAG TPA: polyphosphate polymerase domain-containing protein [Vicinamibacterales bacterium]|nr:polyphosphate polymerase domain-containing protein [Vicinamibacterales bacterium]
MSSSGARETRAFASEIKFLIPRATAMAVREWARRRLTPDAHGSGSFGDEYRTTTIYFDSPAYDVYHRRGSFGRSKYRIRRYDEQPQAFLERKLRRPGMLTKRRTLIELAALFRLEQRDPDEWDGCWFHRRLLLRQLRPVCEVSYHRMAREGISDTGPIRLTLDERMRVALADRPEFGNGAAGIHILEPSMILELKYRSTAPPIFKELVEEFGLRPQTASKYRLGLAALDPQGTNGTGKPSGLAEPAIDGPPCA